MTSNDFVWDGSSISRKRQAIKLSFSPEILDFLETRPNKSRFVEQILTAYLSEEDFA